MTTILPSSFGRVKRRQTKFPWMFVVLALLCVGILVLWHTPVSGMVLGVLKPVFQFREELSKDKIAELESELASTNAALLERDALYQENQELKRLLGRPNASREVLAGVLLRPPATPYDTLLIDIGKSEGVAVGQLVFGGGSSAIGDVSEVYEHTARVSLFSAPGRNHEALVQLSKNKGSILPVGFTGQGAGSLKGQVPAGSLASVGDSVVVPGIGSAFMGKISYIDAPAGSSFETLYVSLPSNLFSLRFVEVQIHL